MFSSASNNELFIQKNQQAVGGARSEAALQGGLREERGQLGHILLAITLILHLELTVFHFINFNLVVY